MSRASWTPAVGERFGRLSVVDTSLRTAPPAKSGLVGLRRFLCVCDCGASIDVDPNALKRGDTRSCGCLRREVGQVRGASSRRHGLWQHPLYKTWSCMVDRCHNENSGVYDRYGGRGIEVYEPWRGDPAPFINWAAEHLGERPPGHSLDRIDNDGNYVPGNLRWATPKTQNNNRRPARWTRWSVRDGLGQTRGS